MSLKSIRGWRSLLHGSISGAEQRAAISTLVIRLLAAAAGFALHLALARLLSLADYGIYTYVFSVCSVSAFFARWGFPGAIVRFLPGYVEASSDRRISGLLCFALGIAAMSALLTSMLAPWWTEDVSPSVVRAMRVLIVAWAFLAIVEGALRGMKDTAASLFGDGVLRPLVAMLALSLICVARNGVQLEEAIWVSAVSMVFAGLWAGSRLIRKLPPGVIRARPEWRLSRKWLGVSGSLLWANLGGMVQAQSVTIILGAISTSTEVALYSVSLRLAMLLAIPLQAVNAFVAPRIAAGWARDDREASSRQLQSLLTRTSLAMNAIALPSALVLLVLRVQILGIFGEAYADGGVILVIIVLGQVVNSLAGSVMFLLTMTGSHRVAAIASSASALLTVVLALLFVPRFGSIGAATATSISMVFQNLVLLFLVRVRTGLDPTPFRALWP